MTIVIDNDNADAIFLGDRWTPVRNGDVFCSPACGCQCKRADFDLATQRAATLVTMLGGGWQPRVWENGGWHFEVSRGNTTVSVNDDGQYEANVRFNFDGTRENCFRARSHGPREAVQAVVDTLNTRIAVLRRTLIALPPSPLEIADV